MSVINQNRVADNVRMQKGCTKFVTLALSVLLSNAWKSDGYMLKLKTI